MMSKFINLFNGELQTDELFPTLIEETLFFVPAVSDLLRGRADAVWTNLHPNADVVFKSNPVSKIPIIFQSFEPSVELEDILGLWKQRVKIVPKKLFFGLVKQGENLFSSIYDPEIWKDFILGSNRFQTGTFGLRSQAPIRSQAIPSNPAPSSQAATTSPAVPSAGTSSATSNVPSSTTSSGQNTQFDENVGPSNGPTQSSEQNNVAAGIGPTPTPETISFENLVRTLSSAHFFDNVCSIPFPFSQIEIKRKGISGVATFLVKPFYNFFVDEYEKAISDEKIAEQILPNIYSFAAEEETLGVMNTIHHQLITLGGRLKENFVDVFNQHGQKIADESKGEFYEDFSSELSQIPQSLQNLFVQKFSTQIFINANQNGIYSRAQQKQLLFPMGISVQIDADRTTEFAEILKQTSMASFFVNDLISEGFELKEKSFLSNSVILEKNNQSLENKVLSLKTWDVGKWLQNNLENGLNLLQNTNAIFYEDQSIHSNDFQFFRNLSSIIFAGKVKDLIKLRLRSYEQVVKGELSSTETVIYKIQKIETSTNKILQETWFLNSNDLQKIDFVDTQVKYNKEYTIKLFAYQLIVGNEYNYLLEELNDDNAFINVMNKANLLLVEVPLHEQIVRVVDNPPIAPYVDFEPLMNVSNEIKIILNGNVDQFSKMPISILPSDDKIFREVRQAQMLEENEPIFFKEDDLPAEFEIFRLNKKPKKWNDFANGKIVNVKTNPNLKFLTPSSVAFYDQIFPNQKYFYAFRTKDNHGHISNPSAIYEVELVDDHGAVYPIIKTTQFDVGADTKVPLKRMRRFLHIEPALTQMIVNEKKSGMVEDNQRLKSIVGHQKVQLGIADESVWSKNWKIRIVSKNSGRKIDLNLLFKNTFRRRND